MRTDSMFSQRWVAETWVTPALFADPAALSLVLRQAAPADADMGSVIVDGYSVQARDPDRGYKLIITGFAHHKELPGG